MNFGKYKTMVIAGTMGLAAKMATATTISIPYINITPISQTISDVLGLLTTIVGTDLPPFISAFAGILIQLAVIGLVLAMVSMPIMLIALLIGHLKGFKLGNFKL
jgi:hypothetical protein